MLLDIGVIQHIQVKRAAQIREHQEPLFKIPGENFRHMQAQSQQQLCDMDKRAAILLIRRRIHEDITDVILLHPEITAKTGVPRGWP